MASIDCRFECYPGKETKNDEGLDAREVIGDIKWVFENNAYCTVEDTKDGFVVHLSDNDGYYSGSFVYKLNLEG
jgi:hypothetical protein